MITSIFLNLVTDFFNGAFSIMPEIAELPFGLDGIFTTAISIFNGAMNTLPYIAVVWDCFLYLLGFEIFMLVLKMFLGDRAPEATETA